MTSSFKYFYPGSEKQFFHDNQGQYCCLSKNKMDKRISEFISSQTKANGIFVIAESFNDLEAQSKVLDNLFPRSTLLLGEEISQSLLTVPINEYANTVQKLIKEWVSDFPSEIVICKDIDILFLPEMELDPLFLFKQARRQKKLIILWPGSYIDDTLFYASPNHDHYRSWPKPEIEHTTIEG